MKEDIKNNKKVIKTEWDLTLLYSDLGDPRIEADVRKIEREIDAFRSAYESDITWLENEDKLFNALTRYENLYLTLPLSAPSSYFNYRQSLNSKDSEAEAKSNMLSQRFTAIENKLLFFGLRLAKISTESQKKFLASKKLEHFHYFLKLIFDHSKHDLTEAEEKIMNHKSLTSYSLWVGGTEKVLAEQVIKFEGKEMPLSEAQLRIRELPMAPRKKLHGIVMARFRSLSDFAEHELNAIVLDKKVNDELRHYKYPYSSTLLNYQNKEETVKALIAATEKHVDLSHRFNKLKAKILGKKTIGTQDRNAAIGKIDKKFGFEESVEIVRSAFQKIDPRFADLLDSYLAKGQIDVFPRVGKSSGAFCSPNINAPTFVLLNHIDNFNSVMTMAHEMGHAIHTEFSKNAQTPIYQGYTISTAEVASTFFENFVFDEVFDSLSKEERIVALHDQINDDMNTIFRQIALFKFEIELHTLIREKGSLTKEQMAELMTKHMSWANGPAIVMGPDDGYAYVYWSHIRAFFYVYAYAFGQLISKALYAELKKDRSFSEKIIKFLSTGGSMSSEDTFKAIGIDVTQPDFFASGIASIGAKIDELEQLTKK